MRKLIRYVRVGLIVEAVVVPVLLLNFWPRTMLGWALILLFGPPLWFLFEGFGEWVNELTPDDPVTGAVYGCVTLLLLVGAYVLLSALLGNYLRPHFY
jgi:hypothetical protein